MNQNQPATGKHVVFTDFENGEGILVDLNSKKYYQLNETAKLIWKGLEEGQPITVIVDQITSTYEVDQDHAAKSVRRLIESFATYSLVDGE